MEKFDYFKEYEYALESVYTFHKKCYQTILTYLQEHGDIELSEEEQRDWLFSFLDMEGNYQTTAIRLTEDKKDFYLDCISESGDKYAIDWLTINHDMIITETLMSLIFDKLENK